MTAAVVLLFMVGIFAIASIARTAPGGSGICAMCAAVSGSWFAMLAMRAGGVTIDPLLIGVLMGESVTGIVYLAERTTAERHHVFRMPLLLTLTLVSYVLLGASGAAEPVAYGVLGTIWSAFGLIALGRDGRARKYADRLIACCKDW